MLFLTLSPLLSERTFTVDRLSFCQKLGHNGIGIDAQKGSKRKDKKSLATTITSERLNMLSRDFNIKGSVVVEDRKKYNDKGTMVTLVIPYKLVKV